MDDDEPVYEHDDLDLTGATARRVVLRDARVREVDLSGAEADQVRLVGARVTGANLTGLRLTEVLLDDVVIRGAFIEGPVEISGDVEGLVVNGVEVAPLVEAELARRHPDYAAMKPTDADGFRRAWDVVEQLWAGTVERARGFTPEQLHESVDGEWSFTETLRHLAFATECWVGRTLRAMAAPHDPLSLPWDGMPDTPGIPRDRSVRPDLDTVLALRHERMAWVREVVDGLTDADLEGEVTIRDGVGWPPAGETMPASQPLLVVLNEEWWHRQFAERDLTALENRSG
ncbi:DinB family protein [Phycicoccus sonneratiae]|uniref:DinB family protein n=1 Tax=Phycicoccus sonneratiae TaxID=2807628 RepID=A0ABS2CI36_9MICO|nr:DinB family protein [Phycicoccus sonneraticus]MBM6399445.1 DinB family protein [Phycicoccus sonneraticus]